MIRPTRQLLLAAAFGGLATAAHAAPPADRAADTRAIVAGERAWGQAYVTGDVASVDRLLADDFHGVNPQGEVYDKARVLKEVRETPHSSFDEVGPVTVRFYGTTAIAQAHEREVGPPPAHQASEHVFTDTWVKIGGRWRIVAAEDVVFSPVK
jgi:hypothetical protein